MRQDIPYDPHQLTPHDRVAAVSPDAEVERHEQLLGFVVSGDHGARVKIYGHDLVFEKYADVRHGESLFEEILVEKRTVYGINALRGANMVSARCTRIFDGSGGISAHQVIAIVGLGVQVATLVVDHPSSHGNN